MPDHATDWPASVTVKVLPSNRVIEVHTSEYARRLLLQRWAPFAGALHRQAIEACDRSIEGVSQPEEAMALFRAAAIESGMLVLAAR
jgi:hypothetical protein